MRSGKNDFEAKGSDIGYPNRYRNLCLHQMAVTPHLLLIDFQDDYCPVFSGTKLGCKPGRGGACTILVDGIR
jgi:xanthine dehydrogenase iron-sulfur cluster and FAD-binding subunit A